MVLSFWSLRLDIILALVIFFISIGLLKLYAKKCSRIFNWLLHAKSCGVLLLSDIQLIRRHRSKNWRNRHSWHQRLGLCNPWVLHIDCFAGLNNDIWKRRVKTTKSICVNDNSLYSGLCFMRPNLRMLLSRRQIRMGNSSYMRLQ